MKILFVCMGNICRSPTAEGVFPRLRSRGSAPALDIEIDSAGTHDYHVGGRPIRVRSQRRRRGIDLTALRARQVTAADFERFDLILAMDRLNHVTLLDRSPRQFHPRIRTLLEFTGDGDRPTSPIRITARPRVSMPYSTWSKLRYRDCWPRSAAGHVSLERHLRRLRCCFALSLLRLNSRVDS